MEPRVRISVKLVPFGTLSYEIPGAPQEAEPVEQEVPRYVGPPATITENLRIGYEEGKTYLAPRTTTGAA